MPVAHQMLQLAQIETQPADDGLGDRQLDGLVMLVWGCAHAESETTRQRRQGEIPSKDEFRVTVRQADLPPQVRGRKRQNGVAAANRPGL